MRKGGRLGEVLHYLDVDKILSDSVGFQDPTSLTRYINPLTLMSGRINYIDGLNTIELRLQRNNNAENILTIGEANVNSLFTEGYGSAADKKEEFNINDLKYKIKITIDKNSIINGNITNAYKNPDDRVKDYIYGTLNGNLKTNNEFYLYGTLNGDLWMRGGLSRKFDNFGTHNGQIHNYDDIGYKYD